MYNFYCVQLLSRVVIVYIDTHVFVEVLLSVLMTESIEHILMDTHIFLSKCFFLFLRWRILMNTY